MQNTSEARLLEKKTASVKMIATIDVAKGGSVILQLLHDLS